METKVDVESSSACMPTLVHCHKKEFSPDICKHVSVCLQGAGLWTLTGQSTPNTAHISHLSHEPVWEKRPVSVTSLQHVIRYTMVNSQTMIQVFLIKNVHAKNMQVYSTVIYHFTYKQGWSQNTGVKHCMKLVSPNSPLSLHKTNGTWNILL